MAAWKNKFARVLLVLLLHAFSLAFTMIAIHIAVAEP